MIAENRRSVNIFYGFQIQTCVIIAPVILFFMRAREKNNNRSEENNMDINQKLTEELEVKRWQVDAAVKLIDEGNTIPFISRYRKEVTGSLNDEQLRKLHERLVYLRNLEEKKEQVLSSIEEQGKLTEELRSQILAAETLVVVEDLYRPYRPKRRTRATIAKRKRSGASGSGYHTAAAEATA